MNLADLSTVCTLFGCPVVAGLIAASEKAGWYTMLFAIFGAVFGLLGAYGIRRLGHWLLLAGGRRKKGWGSALFQVGYLLVPMAAFALISVAGSLTSLLVGALHG